MSGKGDSGGRAQKKEKKREKREVMIIIEISKNNMKRDIWKDG